MPQFHIIANQDANAHKSTVVKYHPLISDNVQDSFFVNNVIEELNRLIPPVEQYEDPFVRFPVRECIRSLVQHARDPFFVSSKPHSVSCDETLQYRFNPLTGSFGVDADWEVKTLTLARSKKKGDIEAGIHMYVMPSNVGLAKKETRDATMFKVDQIGLAAGIITPVTFLGSLAAQNISGHPAVHLRLAEEDKQHLLARPFLTNNLGAHTLSCTVPSHDYLTSVDDAYRRYRLAASGVEVSRGSSRACSPRPASPATCAKPSTPTCAHTLCSLKGFDEGCHAGHVGRGGRRSVSMSSIDHLRKFFRAGHHNH